MRFPVVLHTDDGTRYGVTVPDLPGCFSGGDTFDAAMDSAAEAIDLHLEGLTEDGHDVPTPQPIGHHQKTPDYEGGVWALVEVDVTRFEGKAEKINITLPASLIRRIDDFVARHPEYRSRSDFLAQSALDRITHSA